MNQITVHKRTVKLQKTLESTFKHLLDNNKLNSSLSEKRAWGAVCNATSQTCILSAVARFWRNGHCLVIRVGPYALREPQSSVRQLIQGHKTWPSVAIQERPGKRKLHNNQHNDPYPEMLDNKKIHSRGCFPNCRIPYFYYCIIFVFVWAFHLYSLCGFFCLRYYDFNRKACRK